MANAQPHTHVLNAKHDKYAHPQRWYLTYGDQERTVFTPVFLGHSFNTWRVKRAINRIVASHDKGSKDYEAKEAAARARYDKMQARRNKRTDDVFAHAQAVNDMVLKPVTVHTTTGPVLTTRGMTFPSVTESVRLLPREDAWGSDLIYEEA